MDSEAEGVGKELTDSSVQELPRKSRDRTTVLNGGERRKSRKLDGYYAALVRNLRLDEAQKAGAQAVGVTRTSRCSAKSVVATNLAVALARSMDRPVLMVNCNPTNPLPEQVFSAADCLGIYDLLDEGVFRSEAIHGTGLANLKFIGRGKSTHRGAAFNSLLHFGLVLNELRSMFDVVIADLPYASPLTNCYDLAKSLDGVILEIESRRVRRLEATEIVDQLEFVSSPVLGCVFKQ